MATPHIVGLLALASATAGCFDVSTSSGSPILIDNFDDGVLPADHHFGQWRCGQFNPATKLNCDCGYDGYDDGSHHYSLYLKATLTEGSPNPANVGAHVYTHADVPEDLSHRSALVFSAKLDYDYPSSKSTPTLYVELHCSLAPSDSLSADPQGLKVKRIVTYASDWQQFVFPLYDDFFSLDYAGITGGKTTCLQQIDSIDFSVNAQLNYSETGTIDVHVDDVYFR